MIRHSSKYLSHPHTKFLKRLRATVILLTALFVWSCGGKSSIEKSLNEIETAILENNYEAAAKMAERISTTSGEPGFMTARQSARLSIIYMQLADHDNEDTNTAIAVNYCREAIKNNPDTVEAYYAQLPSEQVAYVSALLALVQNINNPIHFGPDDPDSLATDSLVTDSIH